ncbi:MAG: hypothetical protein BMS9Abin07_0482 [Acidimicrobiia bacterium]|nr:MAG: hypothetical protein BMS9Abin07_0482 [Acidimicrobiia bacterium]
MSYPSIPADTVPWLTVDQMVEADRLAIDEFGIGLLQMMEHAGRGLATVVDSTAPDGEIVVLAGGGNNGGGGLCAARHLVNLGRSLSVVMASDRPGPAAVHHLATLEAMGIEPEPEPPEAPVVVDALVGYGLDGPLRSRAADLASWSSARTVISLDLPSGHGHPGAITPTATVTLALPKERIRELRPLYLADLGLPRVLWRRMGIDPGPVFAEGPILEVV